MFKAKIAILSILCLLIPFVAQAVDEQELTMQILTAQKKLVVLQNMDFTANESEAFWPVYDKFQADLMKVNQRGAKLIGTYAAAYPIVFDEEAKAMMTEFFEIQEMRLNLKKDYVQKFEKVIPANKVMRYFQIENKLEALARAEIFSQIPLVE